MPDKRPTRELSLAVLEGVPEGIAVITAPGTIAWANRGYFETTGRTPEILGRPITEFADDEGSWSPPIRTAVEETLRHGTSASFRSIRAILRGGADPTFLDVDVRPLSSRAATGGAALLFVRDVSERVRDEEQARLFREAFLSSTNAMQLTDARGVMVDVNPAYERIYGYRREECIGRKPNLVRSRFTPPEIYEQMWKDLKDPDRGYWSGELLNRDRRGVERPVLLSVTAIRDARGEVTHYLGVAVDRSEQRNWERRIAHSDKLASVGQLAAGVAHEINTPLANVMLVAESLRRRSTNPEVIARLDTLTDQVELAARIVRSLLVFSRREEPKAAELDLVAVAREAVRFLQGKQSADVEITEVYAGEPVPVTGDRGQLVQVVTNLLNNAYDAQEGRGSIRVVVRRDADRALLEIRDGGPGIPPEVLQHLFEPFFTTKAEGRGTGLGLAVCLGIVQAHHGTISARNAPGGGAVFRVSLPLHAPSPPTVP
jgi:PAS domain S-box-containing protein